jgi:hypothetical protein
MTVLTKRAPKPLFIESHLCVSDGGPVEGKYRGSSSPVDPQMARAKQAIRSKMAKLT